MPRESESPPGRRHARLPGEAGEATGEELRWDSEFGEDYRDTVVECWGKVRGDVSLAMGLIPVLGDVKGLVEAGYGMDLITGVGLDWSVRLLNLLCLSELKVLSPTLRAAKSIGRYRKAVTFVEGKPSRRLVGDVYGGILRSEEGRKAAIEELERLRTLLAANVTRGKDFEEQVARYLRGIGVKFDARVFGKISGGGAVYLDFLVDTRVGGMILECKDILWLSRTYQNVSNVRSMLGRIGRQVSRHKLAFEDVKSYTVVFKYAPGSPVVEKEVLQWARELGIDVAWGLPAGVMRE